MHRWTQFEQQPFLVGRFVYTGQSHGCCPVRATGGSLPRERDLLVPLRFYGLGLHQLSFLASILYAPMDNIPLQFIQNV